MIPFSLLLGGWFSYLHVPAAWILAAIIAAGTMALTTGQELPVNRHFYALARGFIGMLAGLPLAMTPPGTLLNYLPAALTMTALSVAVGIGGGVLLHRAQPQEVSWETGILSMLPGGASLMPALASDLGADYRYVALTQYLRLLAVSVTLPWAVSFLTPPAPVPSPGAGVSSAVGAVPGAFPGALPGAGAAVALDALPGGAESPWWMLLVILAIALSGGRLGTLLRLPAAAVLGPLLLTVAVSAVLPAGYSLQLPGPLLIVAYLSIGWVCGGGLSVPALRTFAKQLPATIAFIVIIIGVCALTAWPLIAWIHITHFEAYLATSPGALETVLALSAAGGAGAAVVTVQIVRLVIVLVIAGYLPQLLRLFRARQTPR